MGQPITVVDSFTSRPFAGNPAGVCVLSAAAPEPWMQAVAAELNLAETAFLVPRPDGDWDLRWFTPTVEIDLCGHATLASAHVLGGAGRFHTRSGLLTCEAGSEGAIEMDFPAKHVAPVDGAEPWAAALGLDPSRVVQLHAGDGWTLLEVIDAATVRDVVMDRDRVLALGGDVLVAADTAGDDSPHDSVCRMFGPAVGIDEDPATGSAHCVLGPWLAGRHGGTTFQGHQASARGGDVGMRVDEDRVILIGHAVTVWHGELVAEAPTA